MYGIQTGHLSREDSKKLVKIGSKGIDRSIEKWQANRIGANMSTRHKNFENTWMVYNKIADQAMDKPRPLESSTGRN